MKKILLAVLLFIAFGFNAFSQDNSQLHLFPVVDGKVMYEKVVDADGKKQYDMYQKAFEWYNKKFRSDYDHLISHEESIGQLIFSIKTDVDIYTVNFTLQLDFKDNKYRYRIFDITRTVRGKEDALFFRKYLVDVPAETDNAIVSGQKKGYNKSQKADIEKAIAAIDIQLNEYLISLDNTVNYTPKPADF